MDNNMVEIISLAILTESIITYFKEFFVGTDFSFSMLFSILLSVLIAVCYKLDLLECISLKSSIPYVGSILTGILISRGSNYIYDISKLIANIN